ncbi:MAG: UDP-N-acetylmuramate--L-alanine ligase [Clostridiales Family XIII bacterium]|jgi:UDP-N-acetylmuramate--alanine ligase|nr:UDP-N-acetylmuramate--L-alanine ligase [Clostridiales Family XIII bacterium]
MSVLTGKKHVHCVGIGGIGLSAIAEILLARGFAVSGSDMKESEITDRLIGRGAAIYLGHRGKNISGADLIVYSAAVSPENPELALADKLGVETVTRAQALGALMADYENSVAIAGTHGKTTTTSMISLILKESGRDPTILVGGNLSEIGGNVEVGGGDCFVTEACEYMDSFLSLAPKYAVILNIDSDHLDYFMDIEHIARSFERFAGLTPPDGAVVAYDANPFVNGILKNLNRRAITFGFYERCSYVAADIAFNQAGMPGFTVLHEGKTLCDVQLAIPGEHNIANALAAFACCHDMGVDAKEIKRTVEKFEGTQRRFDPLGETENGVRVVDDYAHHPAEIAATLKAAKNIPHGELWCLFQPHTYTRTIALFNEFVGAFAGADRVLMAEIYAAREKNIHRISSKAIVDGIKALHPEKDARYFAGFDEMAAFVRENAKPGDLVITMGAGDIYKVGEMILDLDHAVAPSQEVTRGVPIR